MKILFCGYSENSIIEYLKHENEIIITSEKLNLETIIKEQFDFLISYGYRYIIRENILNYFGRNAINLHISYLPYNRGSNPNFWSFYDKTPKGVTIHYLDKELDKGDILFQKMVDFDKNDTLETSYIKLKQEIEQLFINSWKKIKNNELNPIKQDEKNATTHKMKDFEKIFIKFPKGYNTPICEFEK